MVKFSDLLVEKSLHGLVCCHLVASLIFMSSSIMYSLVTLTIDGVTLFLQLMDIQNISKNRYLVQTRVTGNSNILFKMEELKDLLKFFSYF